jgi:Dolichyl-phosphate-mannose-protein mannosyltransferase
MRPVETYESPLGAGVASHSDGEVEAAGGDARTVVSAGGAERAPAAGRLRRIVAAVASSSSAAVTIQLALILGVGAFVRVWQLGAIGFNSDEAVYAGQGASMAGVPSLTPYFPVFRAHPLLFQALLSVSYDLGGGDVAARAVSAAFGLGTIVAVFLLGCRLYGRSVGLAAALFIALMPYDVVVSRQVLLDGPTTFFATVTLYLLACYGETNRSRWLYAAAGTMGLALLAKETSILLLGSVYVFLALSRHLRLRPRHLLIAAAIVLVEFAAYPLTPMLAGAAQTGHQYLIWQLFRRPNHGWGFYLTQVPPSIGLAVVAAAAAGVIAGWRLRTWRETLLISAIAVPFAFFELWPVKGFQYLLPTAPPIAVLAARAVIAWPFGTTLRIATITLIAIGLGVSSWRLIDPSPSTTFLAGSGGVPGGREAGHWIGAHTPVGSELITIGPSMANIVEFYGHRTALGLAVSPNPLHRNPAYPPVHNPDLLIRRGQVQYMVWDAYSANRSSFFSNQLRAFVDRYNGRAVHTETILERGPGGTDVRVPVIVVYQVHP